MTQGFRKDGTKLGFQKGYVQTEEHRIRISLALKNKEFSEIHRKKIRESKIGRNKGNQFWKNRNPTHPNLIRTQFKMGVVYPYTRISKPQIELYREIKKLHPDAEINFPIKTLKTVRYADVAIPSLNLDVEYNSYYWHQNFSKDYDREQELKKVGWKVFVVEDEEGLETIKELIHEILNKGDIYQNNKTN